MPEAEEQSHLELQPENTIDDILNTELILQSEYQSWMSAYRFPHKGVNFKLTLEHHWKNLVETAPHLTATGETLTIAAYTGTPLEGL